MGRKRTAVVPGKPGSSITWSSPWALVQWKNCWFPPPSPQHSRSNTDVLRLQHGKEAMPLPEHRVMEHNRKQDNGEPSAQPIGFELPPAIRAELLNPALWQDGLAKYARATHLAVALADAAGRLIGETINPRPTWSLLHAKPPTGIRSQESGVRDQESADRSDVPHLSPDSCLLTPGGCPFSLAPLKSCHCAADALAR